MSKDSPLALRRLASARRQAAICAAGRYVVARHLRIAHVFAALWRNANSYTFGSACLPVDPPAVDRLPAWRQTALAAAEHMAWWAWDERDGAASHPLEGIHEPDAIERRAVLHLAGLLSPEGGPLWPELCGAAHVLALTGRIASSRLAWAALGEFEAGRQTLAETVAG